MRRHERQSADAQGPSSSTSHPGQDCLERFFRHELSRADRRAVVRHLLTGCLICLQGTRQLWKLGDHPSANPVPAQGLETSGLELPTEA